MTTYLEHKKELMKNWRFRLRWYLLVPKYLLIRLQIRLLNKLNRAATIGKCVVCDDPIYDFQAIDMDGKFIPLHRGCVCCLKDN